MSSSFRKKMRRKTWTDENSSWGCLEETRSSSLQSFSLVFSLAFFTRCFHEIEKCLNVFVGVVAVLKTFLVKEYCIMSEVLRHRWLCFHIMFCEPCSWSCFFSLRDRTELEYVCYFDLWIGCNENKFVTSHVAIHFLWNCGALCFFHLILLPEKLCKWLERLAICVTQMFGQNYICHVALVIPSSTSALLQRKSNLHFSIIQPRVSWVNEIKSRHKECNWN